MFHTNEAQSYSAGDRWGAKRDPKRGDRGIPGDPPRSLQLLSSERDVLSRLEEAEVGPTEEFCASISLCLRVDMQCIQYREMEDLHRGDGAEESSRIPVADDI